MNEVNRSLLRAELTRDEGEVLIAYQDNSSEKLWTIGVGHLIDDKSGAPRVLRITKQESQAWLSMDIEIAYQRAKQYVPEMNYWAETDLGQGGFSPHNQSRCRAIVNMTFNLGNRIGGFKKFLAAINRHDWQAAADEMMDSKWATQVGDRAKRLKAMILTED